jgi:hypothetical protein
MGLSQLAHGALLEYRDRTAGMSPEDRGHGLDADDAIQKVHTAGMRTTILNVP